MKRFLIVVDYQVDFVDGALGFPDAVRLEKKVAEKIRVYRDASCDIAFTFDTHGENYLATQEGKRLPVPHCIRESAGWELFGEVKGLALPEDRRFLKPCFGSEELFDFLRENEYDAVELVGVITNICVISNAVLAKTALPEAEVMVDASCCAGNDAALHEKALDVMESLHISVCR